MNRRRITVVTGASAGVGRATAVAFGKRGDTVALLARGRERLEAACRETEAAGGKALPIQLDVADPDQVEAAAERIETELGPIDVWVNNAMVTVFSPFKKLTAEEYRRATEVTYLGFVYGTMAALKRMLPRDRGTIVQVGSALAYRAIPLQSAYCGAKHAVKGFTESLRTELLHDRSNVRVTMVHLPALNTPQFDWSRTKMPLHPQPVPPIYQPDVAAEAIVWASEHRRRELFVGSPTVATVLAAKFFPGLTDYYLAETGYESQQTEEPIGPDRPDNLFEPPPGDFGTHGSFDNRSQGRSWQLWATTHLLWPGFVDLAIGAGTGAMMLAKFVRRQMGKK